MYLILYPLLVLASLLITLVTYMLSPVLAALAGSDGNLPRWLYWFQTFDNTIDAGWQVQGNYGTYLATGIAPTGLTLWWYRVCWLCRNPAYGWDYWPFGVGFDATQWRVFLNGANWWVALGPSGAFCVRSLAAGVSFKFGWKAWAYWQNDQWAPASYSWGPSRRAPLCFTL